ncbi:hypothetical protein MSAN_00231200 [Mycena sanguinolenta]|uniref:Uncharacterized protein n=1 Tax=Mycena sanguinolenta TaxID=230812 RepID=A0A8H7DNX5_9AGAR|nr:hypothetical protein MSAN_00231200 [Mycena sanguinolenta]
MPIPIPSFPHMYPVPCPFGLRLFCSALHTPHVLDAEPGPVRAIFGLGTGRAAATTTAPFPSLPSSSLLFAERGVVWWVACLLLFLWTYEDSGVYLVQVATRLLRS